MFYQDLKARAEGEIFKSDKTRTASILTGLKSSSFCELLDKVFQNKPCLIKLVM